MIPRPKKVNIRNLIWSSAHVLKTKKEKIKDFVMNRGFLLGDLSSFSQLLNKKI
jgi:hypothetical protein